MRQQRLNRQIFVAERVMALYLAKTTWIIKAGEWNTDFVCAFYAKSAEKLGYDIKIAQNSVYGRVGHFEFLFCSLKTNISFNPQLQTGSNGSNRRAWRIYEKFFVRNSIDTTFIFGMHWNQVVPHRQTKREHLFRIHASDSNISWSQRIFHILVFLYWLSLLLYTLN